MGPDNSLLNYTFTSYEQPLTSALVASPGTTYSAPSMIVQGGDVDISAMGASDSLDFYWSITGSNSWTPETVAGDYTTYSAPSMISTAPPSTSASTARAIRCG
jgi:hypothetical protein